MKWVIENNVADEEQYDDFIAAVESFDIDYSIIRVVPFSHQIIPEVITVQDVFAYGSVALCNKVAPNRGWKVFSNPNFDYEVWSKKWEGAILNAQAEIGPFNSVPINEEQFFIRPCKDNKAFSGKVMSAIDYHNWVDALNVAHASGYEPEFDMNEIVMVSPVQNIQEEIRFYIVDGGVITHSVYRQGGKITYSDSSKTPPAAIEFVEELISEWMPDEAFVLDLALVDYEYKVIEINCINCSGFYQGDVRKLVSAFVDHFKMKDIMSG